MLSLRVRVVLCEPVFLYLRLVAAVHSDYIRHPISSELNNTHRSKANSFKLSLLSGRLRMRIKLTPSAGAECPIL